MGNTGFTEEINPRSLSRANFSFQYALGRGGFGKVWVVKLNQDQNTYAMKEMLKLRIISKQSIESVLNEQRLLSVLRHPFIVNMKFAFQDRDNLFLVMDLMKGGDLRYHINLKERFSETETKFFAACIVTGLEYLHVNKIIHRDIKPENLVFDNKGYLRITDFGIAKTIRSDTSKDSSGTPGYMAPEVFNRQNHGIAVDYFALGVIVYECMIGRRPYCGRHKQELKEQMMAKKIRLVKSNVPKGWSMESVDFVNKLLERRPEDRLGFGGPHEVKSHAWFNEVSWKGILEKKIDAPFKTTDEDNFDPRVLIGFNDEIDYSLDCSVFQLRFKDYYYDWREGKNKPNESTLQVNNNA